MLRSSSHPSKTRFLALCSNSSSMLYAPAEGEMDRSLAVSRAPDTFPQFLPRLPALAHKSVNYETPSALKQPTGLNSTLLTSNLSHCSFLPKQTTISMRSQPTWSTS